jgi:ankyrin repeat protein
MATQLISVRPIDNLDSLRKQAKQWLKALRSGDAAARQRFQRVHPKPAAQPVLRDVQHALAKELGFASWAQLKLHVAMNENEHMQGRQPLLALCSAARKGDVEIVQALLELHPSLIDERAAIPGSYGKRTALHYGVEHASVINLLLERGADPNIRDDGDNATPLHFAAEHQDIAAIRLLLEHGADPIGEGTMHELDVLGWATAWDYIEAQAEVVDYLLAHGARYSIFSAVALGAIDAIRDIVAREPDALNRPMDATNQWRRPLHLAIKKQQRGALTVLLELGADTETRDRAGLTPLDQATLAGDAEAAQLLIDYGARLELPAAVALGRTADVERLLAEDPHCLKPGGKWASLIVRAAEGAPGSVIETLLRHGASPNAIDDVETPNDRTNGVTALHWAAFRGNVAAARVLLEHGADATRRESKHGSTPLGWAAFAGQEATRQLLLGLPVDIFDAIVMDREERIVELLDQDPAALHRTFGEFSGLKGEGQFITPLGCAVRHNRPALVKLLLGRGARVVTAPNGETLLELAQRRGFEEIGTLLRDRASIFAPADTVWIEAERAVRDGDADRLAGLLEHNEALFREGTPSAPTPGGPAPDYSAMDAKEIIRRNHQFDSWEAYENFREQMHVALSPETRFEAAADAIANGQVEELRWLLRKHPDLVHAHSPRRHRATLLQYTEPDGVEYFRQRRPANATDSARVLFEAGTDVTERASDSR